MVRATMETSGMRFLISRVASIPERSGRPISIKITLGCRRIAASIASWAEDASPMISTSRSFSNNILKPERTTAWSSTSSRRVLISLPLLYHGFRGGLQRHLRDDDRGSWLPPRFRIPVGTERLPSLQVVQRALPYLPARAKDALFVAVEPGPGQNQCRCQRH